MARYVAGETDSGIEWHIVDEAGPDPDVQAEVGKANGLSKTKCGKHFGSDAVTEASSAAPLCASC